MVSRLEVGAEGTSTKWIVLFLFSLGFLFPGKDGDGSSALKLMFHTPLLLDGNT